MTLIHQIAEANQLRALRRNLPNTPDLAVLAQQLRAAAAVSPNGD